ncbi:MAG: magnesium transporter [bacterium]|nr:magnesium transporter [bacterium]
MTDDELDPRRTPAAGGSADGGQDERADERPDERVLDPANLDAERQALGQRFVALLDGGRDDEVRSLAAELSPGDLAEILRPLDVADTARLLRLLPPDPVAEVLLEIDNRSLSALLTLLDVDAIADIVEEMPSDDATDLLGELEPQHAEQIMAAMDEAERSEVADLLQYSPETAGGLMGKEFTACTEEQTCQDAVSLLRGLDQDDLEETHALFVVDQRGRLTGQLPLTVLLLADRSALVVDVMEHEPLYVSVDLDQEEVAGFFMTHDLITLPVVDHQMKLVGRITADDVMDVMEEEATEDFSRLAGVSVAEYGEQSALRVARSRLPWLLGALLGELGAVLVLRHFEQSLQTMVALAFYIPMMMALAGNVGIQTSSVVVRGLATGELPIYRIGRHLGRELMTAGLVGVSISISLSGLSYLLSGNVYLSAVLGVAMLLVVLMSAMVGTGIPLVLNKLGIDPAVATGPFITTTNDLFGLLIYLGLASLMLSLGTGG